MSELNYLNIKNTWSGVEFFRSRKRPDLPNEQKAFYRGKLYDPLLTQQYGDVEIDVLSPSVEELIELVSLGMDPIINSWILAPFSLSISEPVAHHAASGIWAGCNDNGDGCGCGKTCLLFPHNGKFYATIGKDVIGIAPDSFWVAEFSDGKLSNQDELLPTDEDWLSAPWVNRLPDVYRYSAG